MPQWPTSQYVWWVGHPLHIWWVGTTSDRWGSISMYIPEGQINHYTINKIKMNFWIWIRDACRLEINWQHKFVHLNFWNFLLPNETRLKIQGKNFKMFLLKIIVFIKTKFFLMVIFFFVIVFFGKRILWKFGPD